MTKRGAICAALGFLPPPLSVLAMHYADVLTMNTFGVIFFHGMVCAGFGFLVYALLMKDKLPPFDRPRRNLEP